MRTHIDFSKLTCIHFPTTYSMFFLTVAASRNCPHLSVKSKFSIQVNNKSVYIMAQFFRFPNSTGSRDSLKFESMKMVKCDKKSHTLRNCNVMLTVFKIFVL